MKKAISLCLILSASAAQASVPMNAKLNLVSGANPVTFSAVQPDARAFALGVGSRVRGGQSSIIWGLSDWGSIRAIDFLNPVTRGQRGHGALAPVVVELANGQRLPLLVSLNGDLLGLGTGHFPTVRGGVYMNRTGETATDERGTDREKIKADPIKTLELSTTDGRSASELAQAANEAARTFKRAVYLNTRKDQTVRYEKSVRGKSVGVDVTVINVGDEATFSVCVDGSCTNKNVKANASRAEFVKAIFGYEVSMDEANDAVWSANPVTRSGYNSYVFETSVGSSGKVAVDYDLPFAFAGVETSGLSIHAVAVTNPGSIAQPAGTLPTEEQLAAAKVLFGNQLSTIFGLATSGAVPAAKAELLKSMDLNALAGVANRGHEGTGVVQGRNVSDEARAYLDRSIDALLLAISQLGPEKAAQLQALLTQNLVGVAGGQFGVRLSQAQLSGVLGNGLPLPETFTLVVKNDVSGMKVASFPGVQTAPIAKASTDKNPVVSVNERNPSESFKRR